MALLVFMHYALDIRTFLFSHYFYTGLRIATGVIGLTLLAFNYSSMDIATTVFLGALCTSLMDLPSPLRHKFNEMLAGVLLCTIVMLVISLCAPIHWLVSVMMVFVSFFASMIVVYGKKTMPLQFAALMVMTLSMENELSFAASFLRVGFFLGGGLGYLAYSMAVSWFLRRRIKQQILAEALFELARYLRIKADFYDVRSNLGTQFNLLVRQQIVLAEKQQAARDLILRDLYNKQDGLLVQVHLSMLEVYEQVLSTHADYGLLRSYFGDADVMIYLRDLANKAAEDIESVAYAITRNRASTQTVSYKAELNALELELRQIQQDSLAGQFTEEALTTLRATESRIHDIIDLIAQLHLATQTPVDPLPILPGSDMTPFLTQQKFKLSILISNLRWRSPIFRFSLRVALAVTTGLWISNHLPYMAHSYWIVLTIVIIIKPNFSTTKQRMADRLIGTIIGCVLTALVLRFIHEPIGLLGVLFIASVAAPAFTYIKYRYTAIAASVQILLLLNMMLPAGHQGVVGERLIDTLIGVVIATIFSYIFPSWEYRMLPRLLKNVLLNSQRYIKSSRDMLVGKVGDDFFYRVCRKGFMDSISALVSAQMRMMDEPLSKQRAVPEINRFVVQNYLIAAHIAALRILLRRHSNGLPRAAVNALIEKTYNDANRQLDQAQHNLLPAGIVSEEDIDDNIADDNEINVEEVTTQIATPTPSGAAGIVNAISSPEKVMADHIQATAPESASTTPSPVIESDDLTSWSGWQSLEQRTNLLNENLQEIVSQTELIEKLLRKPE